MNFSVRPEVCASLLTLLVVSSCQSISSAIPGPGSIEGTAVAPAGESSKISVQGNELEVETLGSGSIQVAMILPPDGQAPQADALRNGAVMAYNDLSGGTLTLKMVKLDSGASDIQPVLQSFRKDNAHLVSVPASATFVNQASAFMKAGGPPVFAVGNATGTNVYGLVPTEIDSLSRGAAYAASAGPTKMIIATPAGVGSQPLARMKSALGKDDKFLGTVTYPVDAQELKLIETADFLVLMGSAGQATSLAKQLKRNPKRFSNLLRVGHENWPTKTIRNPVHQGAIIAKRDTRGLDLVSKRYRTKYRAQIPASAAYAYDIVATAAGIARGKSGGGLKLKDLLRPSGFRGTTGAFRFKRNGKVERLYEIQQIRNAKLVTVQAAEGF